MKYWRGYLVAFLTAACAWALTMFASTHQELMDTFYPYVTRLLFDALAQWSSSADFCLWQLAILVFAVGVLVSLVLMIILRWNPVQWFGWVLAVVSIVNLLNTGLYSLNQYTGSIAGDLRMSDTPYSMEDLKAAMVYYRDQANSLSESFPRDENGTVEYEDFKTLAEKAGEGFRVMTYQRSASVMAGCRLPVKELGWADRYTRKGITGVTVGLTGEAAVNPQVPDVGLPFAMCREMARRMSIINQPDAAFAAFLACEANPDPQFRYTAFVMAYGYCYDALQSFDNAGAQQILNEVLAGTASHVAEDLDSYRNFTKGGEGSSDAVCTMLVNWHIEKVVLPSQAEEEPLFDPTDETQVDLSGIVAATEP